VTGEVGAPSTPRVTALLPTPSVEEAAAIVAAVEAAWPRPAAVAPVSESRWRWSGRWWTKPVPLDRDRPW
jgi:hypothetical protein